MASEEHVRRVGFIISHQRSGSTYLRTCLNQVETIVAPSESHFLVDYYRNIPAYLTPEQVYSLIEKHPRLAHWRKDNVKEYVSDRSIPEFFFDLLADQSPKKTPQVVLDKTPEYLEITDRLATDFPNAKFIFTSTNKVYGDNPNKLTFVEKKELALKESETLKRPSYHL